MYNKFLQNVEIPEELVVTHEELEELHKNQFESFKREMLNVNPNLSDAVIQMQYDRYFNYKK